MTIKIYRAYPAGETFNGHNHMMSIVATDSDFSYASTPGSGFDDIRKSNLIGILEDNNRPLPTDADSWAGLAMYNTTAFSFINATGDEDISDEDFEDVLDSEIALVNDAKEYRDSMKEGEQ